MTAQNGWENLLSLYRNYDKPHHLKVASLAQWILESGRGTSQLAKSAHNYGGLKWRTEMSPYGSPFTYNAHDGIDVYTAFKSDADFINGYWAFIARAPYRGWEKNSASVQDYLSFIHLRGYATEPTYVSRVMAVVPEAERLLKVEVADEPDRISPREKGQPYVTPEIVYHDANITPRGRYTTRTGQPKGLVVHYTAGHWAQGKHSAFNTFAALQAQGYGCFVMDYNGVIYVPKTLGFTNYAWHAGGTFRGLSVNPNFMGMEICNPGLLAEAHGKFYPYFEFYRWSGRPADLYPSAKPISPELLRTSPGKDNVRAGTYMKYSDAQERSLINFCLWQKATNPEFDLDYIVGHDEINSGKSDPGASLSMSMPEFRTYLKGVTL